MALNCYMALNCITFINGGIIAAFFSFRSENHDKSLVSEP